MQSAQLFDRLKKIIDDHETFLITTHILPDGDGLGAEIALASYLKSLNKKCDIINFDTAPEKFSFLDPDSEIQTWNKNKSLPKVQMVFAVDVNDIKRTGPLSQELEKNETKIIFIDHHLSSEALKKNHVIHEDISSMGEFLYGFFKHVGAEITPKMALALYTSIYTDTNMFQHRKARAYSHEICADLVRRGVDTEMVFQKIHQTKSLNEMHLLGQILNQVQTTPNGKIGWVSVSQELQKKYQAKAEDTEGFVDYLLILKDVEIALLFREEKNKLIKVSGRSKGNIDLHSTFEKLGGGGHMFEVGLLRKGTLEEVISDVMKEIKKLA